MSKHVVMATWDDAPHLRKKDKEDLWESIPAYQRDARAKGIPQLGSGAVYQVREDDIKCDPFEIPMWWPRLYGLDVGWNWTAAVWQALDPESDVLYVYSVYKKGKAEPAVHAEAIKGRGTWIPGMIDPASTGSSQFDGKQLYREYTALLPNLYLADNTVKGPESGIFAVEKRITTGRLKIFSNLTPWFQEFRLYRRDENGKIVKENDHLMDGTRYGVKGLDYAVIKPDMDFNDEPESFAYDKTAGWY